MSSFGHDVIWVAIMELYCEKEVDSRIPLAASNQPLGAHRRAETPCYDGLTNQLRRPNVYPSVLLSVTMVQMSIFHKHAHLIFKSHGKRTYLLRKISSRPPCLLTDINVPIYDVVFVTKDNIIKSKEKVS